MADTKRILLVRNAEAGANVQQRFCRSSPLTETGIDQAKQLGSYLRKWQPLRLWSSPLNHALQTAMTVAAIHDVQVTQVEGLANIETGAWEGLTVSEIQRTWPKPRSTGKAWMIS